LPTNSEMSWKCCYW